jgi:uncharacterized protein YegL
LPHSKNIFRVVPTLAHSATNVFWQAGACNKSNRKKRSKNLMLISISGSGEMKNLSSVAKQTSSLSLSNSASAAFLLLWVRR